MNFERIEFKNLEKFSKWKFFDYLDKEFLKIIVINDSNKLGDEEMRFGIAWSIWF